MAREEECVELCRWRVSMLDNRMWVQRVCQLLQCVLNVCRAAIDIRVDKPTMILYVCATDCELRMNKETIFNLCASLGYDSVAALVVAHQKDVDVAKLAMCRSGVVTRYAHTFHNHSADAVVGI